MDNLTDLEITKRCAEKMGYVLTQTDPDLWRIKHENGDVLNIGSGATILRKYDPLHDDAQCMALAKRFKLFMNHSDENESPYWKTAPHGQGVTTCADTLNRAICECVASMP